MSTPLERVITHPILSGLDDEMQEVVTEGLQELNDDELTKLANELDQVMTELKKAIAKLLH
jgi:hypothetical protein